MYSNFPMSKPALEINGADFDSLEEFWDEVSRQLIPGADWGRNLNAFNDILRGGFGTPEGGFTLRWLDSECSRETLGYPETIRRLEHVIGRCHPDNVESVSKRIQAAKRGEGPTLYDELIEIIRIHGPEGREEEDGVDLVLA